MNNKLQTLLVKRVNLFFTDDENKSGLEEMISGLNFTIGISKGRTKVLFEGVLIYFISLYEEDFVDVIADTKRYREKTVETMEHFKTQAKSRPREVCAFFAKTLQFKLDVADGDSPMRKVS